MLKDVGRQSNSAFMPLSISKESNIPELRPADVYTGAKAASILLATGGSRTARIRHQKDIPRSTEHPVPLKCA